jgi:CMP-N-acetylneuraminic acid synthetase
MRVLAVIPARGGSKAVPRKNIREVGGRPLIAWTIDAALAARELFHDVVVSTDDEEIAEISRRSGASVPFLRPAELATDQAKSLPVIQHATRVVEERDAVRMDWVMILQPTAPARSVDDIRRSLELAAEGGCDSVISVVRVLAHHPILMKKIENDLLVPFCIEEREGTRRQDYAPAAWMRNGAIYLTRRDVLMETGSIWGERIRPLVMPEERSVSIDSEIDLLVFEAMLARR